MIVQSPVKHGERRAAYGTGSYADMLSAPKTKPNQTEKKTSVTRGEEETQRGLRVPAAAETRSFTLPVPRF